jgi:hypothetical protein
MPANDPLQKITNIMAGSALFILIVLMIITLVENVLPEKLQNQDRLNDSIVIGMAA